MEEGAGGALSRISYFGSAIAHVKALALAGNGSPALPASLRCQPLLAALRGHPDKGIDHHVNKLRRPLASFHHDHRLQRPASISDVRFCRIHADLATGAGEDVYCLFSRSAHVSRTTLRGSLSSRIAMNFVCRR
jgi:hypothetical protein